MNKKLLIPIVLAFILAGAIFVIASQIESGIAIYKGWNLIYGFTPSSLNGQGFEFSHIKAIYTYVPTDDEYVRIYPNPENSKIDKLGDSYFEKQVSWVYSDSTVEGELNGLAHFTEYWLEEPMPISQRQLSKGWNFVGISFDMVGKNLNDIKGNCELVNSYAWGSSRQSWYVIDQTTQFTKEVIGQGLVLKVSNDCSLGETTPPQTPNEDIGSIPTLPNGEQKCTDSDGGKNIYVKGTISGISLTNKITTESDYCVEGNLIEYFCNDETNNITPQNRINNEGAPCPTGYTCSNGACVQ